MMMSSDADGVQVSGFDSMQALCDLFGAAFEVRLSRETVLVKPLVMRDLPAFLRWYEKCDFSAERDLVSGEAEANIRVLEMLSGQPFEWINSLEQDDLCTLVKAVVALNKALFEKSDATRGASLQQVQSDGGKALQLAVAQLVEAGHRLQDVQGYTLDQVDILCRAHARLAADRQINALVASRGGQVDAESFKKIVAELNKSVAAL